MIRPVAAAVLALATTVMRLSTSDSDRLSDFDAFWPEGDGSLCGKPLTGADLCVRMDQGSKGYGSILIVVDRATADVTIVT